jgi:hypothetical protein
VPVRFRTVRFMPPCAILTIADRGIWHLSWVSGFGDQTQVAYRIVIVAANKTVAWDSGKVPSANSTYVAYAGSALASASRYTWTVSTWTQSCESAASAPALFVTAPWAGFSPAAQFISTSNSSATFGYFRKEVTVPANTISAVAFVSARVNDFLLSGYKLYVDAALVNIGPGRGEAPVFGGTRSLGTRLAPIISPFLVLR